MDTKSSTSSTVSMEMLEGEANSKQAVNDQVKLNQHLTSQMEDLQKRLEEKEHKLIQAHETIRALKLDILALQKQLAFANRKYLDLLEQRPQLSHFIQLDSEAKSMVCTSPPQPPQNWPCEMNPSSLEIPGSDLSEESTEDEDPNKPIMAENVALLQGASTDPMQTVECVDQPTLTLSCDIELTSTDNSGHRLLSPESFPPPPPSQPCTSYAADNSKLFLLKMMSVKLEDCRHKLGPNGVFIVQSLGDDDSDDGDCGDSSDYIPESDGCESDSDDGPHKLSKQEKRQIESLQDGVFPCDWCSRTFPGLRHLKLHQRTHKNARSHECATCGKVFPHQSTLRVHKRKHTGDRPYTCAICGVDFTYLGALKKHIMSHEETYSSGQQAGTATEDFPYDDTSDTLSRYTRERPYGCGACGKTFSQPGDLHTHQRTHEVKEKSPANNSKRPYICEFCGKSFSQSRVLGTHWLACQSSEGGRPKTVECEECKEMFSSKSALLIHVWQTHKSPYVCTFCKKRFSQMKVLQEHERWHILGKRHQCPHCEKVFKTTSKLRQHVRTHTGERPYLCPECPKAFAKSCGLKAHSRAHTEERLHGCATCGKAFKDRNSLQRHEIIHTGDRPFLCHLCGKMFADCSTLRRHQRVHNPSDRPHACLHCDRRFQVKASLKRHMHRHTQERPHLCNVCGKTFSVKETLQTHQRIHTGEKPFKCEVCGHAFAHRMGLKTHRMKGHQNNKCSSANTGSSSKRLQQCSAVLQ